jgi:hypothetical protein
MAGGNLDSVKASAGQAYDAPDLRDSEGHEDDARLDRMEWPPDAPITPLGIEKRNIWVLDAAQQLISCDTRLSKNDLVLMCGGSSWLTGRFPQFGKPDKGQPAPIVGFDQKSSSEALVIACQRKRVFNPTGRVFGRGAHRSNDIDQKLMLHLGDRVIIAGAPDRRGRSGPISEHGPGKVGELFFPADRALPSLADKASSVDDARALLAEFSKWYWKEPKVAPLLLLGMTAQMFVCGALPWRAHCWLAGPTAAGKSSLQELMRAIHAEWCLHVEDASEPAIRQILGDDTLPVMIDEAEADDNPDRQRAIINLAKKASSGAKIIRGGADHKGQEFTAQSCFLMSSVIHSLAKGEDLNRFAVLDMLAVPPPERDKEGRVKAWAKPDLTHWRETGRRMHRRMIEQWPRFADTLSDYKREIAAHGLAGRWQDTFGTLLACADMLLHDTRPASTGLHDDGYGRERDQVLALLPMMHRGRMEARTDVDRCLAYLMSYPLAGEHGKAPEPVGKWLTAAMTPIVSEFGHDISVNEAARQRLRNAGLRLIVPHDTKSGFGSSIDPPPSDEGWATGWLAIGYSTNQPLAALFRGTEWSDGKWTQSLGKIDGARRGGKIRFSGDYPDNALAIPLSAVRGDGG